LNRAQRVHAELDLTTIDWLDAVHWDERGLVPAVVQDATSGRLLMMAWMNRDALRYSVETGDAHYWSRSRRRLWRKGEQSGHVQRVVEIRLDCDADALLLRVEQVGGIACHTGRASCFFLRRDGDRWIAADAVLKVPEQIYAGVVAEDCGNDVTAEASRS
jgi:phosphoribosyl-AMP cyclohydrolase